ncbi:MAG TPA: class I SAM-dependent methyltransferase [bacterium]|nr:class I SAM-dependent methyltransferase [bacterium]
MFTKSGAFYDAIYAATGKDYVREAQQVHALIQQHSRAPGKMLLDVACGTGSHLAVLREWYEVAGLDLDARMLAIARRRCPKVRFYRSDMAAFRLRRRFDAVICLFSSIGYARTRVRLHRTLKTFTQHTVPGGVVLVEPWIFPEKFEDGHVGLVVVDQPGLKIARMGRAIRQGGLSPLRFHYLVGTPEGVSHFTEEHTLGLFPRETYLEAFRAAGLDVSFDPDGLTGRGLYIGRKPIL